MDMRSISISMAVNRTTAQCDSDKSLQHSTRLCRNLEPTRQTKLMAIKIELEKIFDKINWQFITDMLNSIQVLTKLSNVWKLIRIQMY